MSDKDSSEINKQEPTYLGAGKTEKIDLFSSPIDYDRFNPLPQGENKSSVEDSTFIDVDDLKTRSKDVK
jgi:hypothetical protein